MKVIEITVGPAGEIQLETRGFLGPECREAARSLVHALGASTAERPTAEFYQARPQGRDLPQSS